jgi:hypothetical protein
MQPRQTFQFLCDLLTEDPEYATSPGFVPPPLIDIDDGMDYHDDYADYDLKFGDQDAIAFGYADDKFVYGRNSNPEDVEKYDYSHCGAVTHGGLATENGLPSYGLQGQGRCWIRNGTLYVSLWGPWDHFTAGSIKQLVKLTDAKKVLLETSDDDWAKWIELGGKSPTSKTIISDEVREQVSKLQAELHAAPPEQKIKIRQQIANLLGGKSTTGFGAAKQGKVAAAARFNSPAAMNAARKVSESKQ